MADENIEQLNIEINVSGADVADQRLKSIESRLESIKNALPEINSRMGNLAQGLSSSISNEIQQSVSQFKTIRTAASEFKQQVDGFSQGINLSGGETAQQNLNELEQKVSSISERTRDFGKQWDYLNSPVEVLNAKIRRITNETERYKKAWQETDDTEAQDKLASKIESNTEKLRKLNDEKAKLSEGGEGEATGFDGMLKNVQALSGMFGKTGGQIAGLLGKAEGLKSTFAGLAGTAGKIALPVALVVGSVAAIKGIVNEIKKTATTIWNVTKAIGKAIKNEVKEKIEGLIQPIQRLKKQIGRVVFNRLIREAFNIVQNGVAEGIKNVARGFERANVVLSEYTTQLMYLKNTLGAMIIPLLENLYPAFELVTNAVIKASNAINQFLSLLAGKTT